MSLFQSLCAPVLLQAGQADWCRTTRLLLFICLTVLLLLFCCSTSSLLRKLPQIHLQRWSQTCRKVWFSQSCAWLNCFNSIVDLPADVLCYHSSAAVTLYRQRASRPPGQLKVKLKSVVMLSWSLWRGLPTSLHHYNLARAAKRLKQLSSILFQ